VVVLTCFVFGAVTGLAAFTYLVFGLFSPGQAETLWWPFGLSILVLASLHLLMDRRRRRR
jgi:hypothetical protein